MKEPKMAEGKTNSPANVQPELRVGGVSPTFSPFKSETAHAPAQRRSVGLSPSSLQSQGPERVQLSVLSTSSEGQGLNPEVSEAMAWLAKLLYFKIDSLVEAQDSSDSLPSCFIMIAELCVQMGGSGLVPEEIPPFPDAGCLATCCELFALSEFEGVVLAAALAPAFDGRFAACFQFLNGANPSERASADLVAQLLGLTGEERVLAGSSLRRGRALEQFALLNLDWTETASIPPHRQPLMLSSRLLWHLLDGSQVEPLSLGGVIKHHSPQWTRETVPLEAKALLGVDSYVETYRSHKDLQAILVLEGPPGSGHFAVAETIAQSLDYGVLYVHLGEVLFGPEGPLLAAQLMREAILREDILFLSIESGDILDEKGDAIVTEQQVRRVLHLLEYQLRRFGRPLIVTGDYAALAMVARTNRDLRSVRLSLPDRSLQRRIIEASLQRLEMTIDDELMEDVLNRYNLDHQTADDVLTTAKALSKTRYPQQAHIKARHMEEALETVLSHSLSALSERMMAKATWEDILLPDDLMVQLKALSYLIEHRFRMFEEWGLRKVGAGKGVKALFSGPSGTGKTLAAEVISSGLRLPLYRVDMSQLVSKWVGETEKNIDKIFRDAQASQAILLFDEADSLFGSRGSVEGGNDRWANFQVNYLLQRFETHDGVVLLTSNMPNAIDTAFARRMHFVVEFRLPDEGMRKAIWEGSLNPNIPMENDIDVSFLAERFELSAANIKNVVMAGAFLAAAEGECLNMKQLVRGMQLEFQKIGRGVSRGDFGPYFKHLDLEPY